MLFIVSAFGEQPDLVSAIVEPLALGWRKIFAFIFRIDEQIGMPGKRHLYDSSAILWNHDQLHPAIRNLLRMPSFVVDGINLTTCASGLRRLRVNAYRWDQRNYCE